MNRLHAPLPARRALCLAGAFALLSAQRPVLALDATRPPPNGTLHALLVGVSRCPGIPGLAPLQGVAADVDDMRSLALQLGVPDWNLAVLSDTAADATAPTLAHIQMALNGLEQRLAKGHQLLIYLGGHGAQQPVVTGSEQSGVEFDGLDEVFLAADARPYDWAARTVPGGLTDNMLGQTLNALADKGVQVWLVVDSCHAGTMTRGQHDDSTHFTPVAWRGASLLQMGLDQSSSWWQRLVSQGERVRTRPRALARPRHPQSSMSAQIPLVTAFYATPEQGMAMEVRRKQAWGHRGDGAAGQTSAAGHTVRGLFTLILAEEVRRLLALPGGESVLSYRLLMQRVLARYRTQAPPDAPMPAFEGLDAGGWFGRTAAHAPEPASATTFAAVGVDQPLVSARLLE